MYESDPDVFAILIPSDEMNMAGTAFDLDHNKDRFVRAATPHVARVPCIGSRESTPGPFLDGDDPAAFDHLVLRFSDDLKDATEGVQLGTSPESDVLLGARGTIGVSRRQGTIILDDDLRVWYTDWHSTFGSSVGYDGKAILEVHRYDRWILAYEPGRKSRWTKITVHTTNGLAFEIRFPNQEASPSAYVENLRAYHSRCSTAVPPMDALGLIESNFPQTQGPSQAHTPGRGAIYIDDGYIGKGVFGEVRRVIKARDGDIYALKRFFPPKLPGGKQTSTGRDAKKPNWNDKKRKRDDEKKKRGDEEKERKTWVEWKGNVKREYELMKNNPHPTIMPVLDYQEKQGVPFIVMPYYRRGSLESHSHGNDDFCVKVLLQLLLGLRHLHARGVVHRDLKLANLLVDDDFNIVIADLGLSRFAADELYTTFCGTLDTVAPEVFPAGRASGEKYGTKADIWSAGVVITHLYLKIMPEYPAFTQHKRDGKLQAALCYEWNVDWNAALLQGLWEHIEDEAGDQVHDLLVNMLERDPKERFSAEQCLERGCEIHLFQRSADGGYVVASGLHEANTPSSQQTQAVCLESPGSSPGPDLSGTLRAPLPARGSEPSPQTFLSGSLWNSVGCPSQMQDNGTSYPSSSDPL